MNTAASAVTVPAAAVTLPVQGTYGVRNGMDDRPMMDPDWAANIPVLQNFLYTDMTAEKAIAAGSATPATADGEETAVPEPVEVQSKKNRPGAGWESRGKAVTPCPW